MTADEVIALLGLKRHPAEGGFFVETYRAAEVVQREGLPARYTDDHRASTAIYYLLRPGTMSAMHRIKTDEVFHFYRGDPVEQLLCFPDGHTEVRVLGVDLAAGQVPQATYVKYGSDREADVTLILHPWPEEKPLFVNYDSTRRVWRADHRGFRVVCWKTSDGRLLCSAVSKRPMDQVLQIASAARQALDK